VNLDCPAGFCHRYTVVPDAPLDSRPEIVTCCPAVDGSGLEEIESVVIVHAGCAPPDGQQDVEVVQHDVVQHDVVQHDVVQQDVLPLGQHCVELLVPQHTLAASAAAEAGGGLQQGGVPACANSGQMMACAELGAATRAMAARTKRSGTKRRCITTSQGVSRDPNAIEGPKLLRPAAGARK
jgi:hypothetical protein